MLCRLIVAITFVMSAVWKLSHRIQYRAAVVTAWHLPAKLVTASALVVPVVELLVGASLIALPATRLPVIAAALFIVGFSLFLARAQSLANGCGCWRPARQGTGSARPYLARNALLAILAALAASSPASLSPRTEAVIFAIALLPAWLIMEAPVIVEVLSSLSSRPHPRRPGTKAVNT
jgi:hypothetical protein